MHILNLLIDILNAFSLIKESFFVSQVLVTIGFYAVPNEIYYDLMVQQVNPKFPLWRFRFEQPSEEIFTIKLRAY